MGVAGVRHCGILIRSICEYVSDGKTWQATDNFIEVPCNTVNELIDGSTVKDFLRHITHLPMSIHGNVMDLEIVEADLPKEDIYAGRRYGLSDKTADPANFRNAPYRFVIMVKKIKKQKSDLVKIM